MPHDICGTEIKNGDRVEFPHSHPSETGAWVVGKREGVVVAVYPGADTCNAQVACVEDQVVSDARIISTLVYTVTLSQCRKVQDDEKVQVPAVGFSLDPVVAIGEKIISLIEKAGPAAKDFVINLVDVARAITGKNFLQAFISGQKAWDDVQELIAAVKSEFDL